MEHTYTLPEALIVAALAALWGAFLFFKHRERQQRVELVHQERLAAMEKGIPLPELPLDPGKTPRDPRTPLLHGIAWTALALGGIVAMFLIPNGHLGVMWPLGLPLLFLGVGLMLYYALGTKRTR